MASGQGLGAQGAGGRGPVGGQGAGGRGPAGSGGAAGAGGAVPGPAGAAGQEAGGAPLRLTRGQWAFAALDLVLVVLLVVLVVQAVSAGGGAPGAGEQGAATPGATSPTSGGAEPTGDGEGTAADAGPASFRLPSGNIACAMSADGVTCTIANIRFEPPMVPGCTGTTGHVFVLNADGVTIPCEDGTPPAVAEDTPVLEYGSAATAGDYTCTSATDGVTCTDAAGVGFRLRTAEWVQLP